MIHFEHVSKSFGEKKAVDDLTLTIEDGKVFGFIGPNGAGKTTTIKMLTGILEPDSGVVTLNGVDITRDPIQAKRMFGYVPDTFDMYERLTGMEYLRFMGDIYGVDARKRKEHIDRYLELFSLTDAAGQQIRSYSHGMKQKLAITGALMHEPSIWILDEPMVGLDPQSVFMLKEEMRKHAESGRTVFFSTHVLDVAERLCDEIGIINKGKLIANGTLDELRHGETGSTLEELFLELVEKEA
ncbi:MAG TPA: ABC transporter ATP-binding protein [Candidatus Limiplasma stercoravium]|nr:ABC transporter ATP-binding protein [Candidatus Limiplasma stercoravium]